MKPDPTAAPETGRPIDAPAPRVVAARIERPDARRVRMFEVVMQDLASRDERRRGGPPHGLRTGRGVTHVDDDDAPTDVSGLGIAPPAQRAMRTPPRRSAGDKRIERALAWLLRKIR